MNIYVKKGEELELLKEKSFIEGRVIITATQISKRCGKSTCEFYNKHNSVSGCNKFEDRKECSISMKQRRKAKNKSKRNNSINWW